MDTTPRKTVWAAAAAGNNMSFLQLLGASGPKWDITCGHCSCSWSTRIPRVDYPGLPCPSCGTINKLNLVIEDD